jgi:hypothetical protein
MSQKYKKPVINEKTLVNNPFIGYLTIRATKNVDTSRYAPDGEVGSTSDDKVAYFNKDYLMENDVPVRVYVSADRRKSLNSLSPNSSKLLGWCIQEFDIKVDWFWLNKQRYMDETGVAYNTYKKSVKELQDMRLILKTSYTDVFWINPHYFFRGNRVNFYGDHEGVLLVRDMTTVSEFKKAKTSEKWNKK